MGIKGLTGPRFRTKGRIERHSLVFLLSLLSCFFCLDYSGHGFASLNWSYYSTPLFCQIVFDMHEFTLFPFTCIEAINVFGIK